MSQASFAGSNDESLKIYISQEMQKSRADEQTVNELQRRLNEIVINHESIAAMNLEGLSTGAIITGSFASLPTTTNTILKFAASSDELKQLEMQGRPFRLLFKTGLALVITGILMKYGNKYYLKMTDQQAMVIRNQIKEIKMNLRVRQNKMLELLQNLN